MESLRRWMQDYGWKILGVSVVITLVGPAWLVRPANGVVMIAIGAWFVILFGGCAYFAVVALLNFMANGGRRP